MATYKGTATVTYSASGATNVPSSQSLSKTLTTQIFNISITLSSARPVKANYTFSYWQGSDGNTYQPGASVTFSFNASTNWSQISSGNYAASLGITLTAKWTYNPTIRVVNANGDGLDYYKIFVVDSNASSLVRYRATVVNSNASALENYS